MKTPKLVNSWISLLILTSASLALSGCASNRNSTTATLQAAGFEPTTPATAQQQASYATMPPYALQTQDVNGQTVYTYAAKDSGTVYVGYQNNYDRYQQLSDQQDIENQMLVANAIKQDPMAEWWSFWRLGGPEAQEAVW